jgi:hypothetical protein
MAGCRARCWVLRKQAFPFPLAGVRGLGPRLRPAGLAAQLCGGAGWFRLLLENCTVDASIFCNLRLQGAPARDSGLAG